MNITPALIYWITRLDAINAAAKALTIIFGSATALCLGFGISEKYNDTEDGIASTLFWFARRTSIVVLVTSLVLIFAPTKKEMAAIIVIPRIANSETVAEIGDGVKTLAVEWLEELRPNKKEEAR